MVLSLSNQGKWVCIMPTVSVNHSLLKQSFLSEIQLEKRAKSQRACVQESAEFSIR